MDAAEMDAYSRDASRGGLCPLAGRMAPCPWRSRAAHSPLHRTGMGHRTTITSLKGKLVSNMAASSRNAPGLRNEANSPVRCQIHHASHSNFSCRVKKTGKFVGLSGETTFPMTSPQKTHLPHLDKTTTDGISAKPANMGIQPTAPLQKLM